MRNKIFILIVVLFCVSNVTAQDRECGMEAHMAEMMKDPDFAREWELNQKKFKTAVNRSLSSEFRQSLMDPIVIPVAVHFPAGLESDRACLEALAQNQIDILNGDFTATNPDANLWATASGFYPGVNHGVANIQFCIATAFHPEDTDEDLVEGGPAVTIGYDFGGGNDSDPSWGGYMNFLVKDIGAGLLGYSPLGGSINAGQSVVINLGAFGSGAGCVDSGIVPQAAYNLGRTVTHELGHFYQLQHPFSGSCDSDDGIADTPNIIDANYGCPDPGSIAGCDPGEFALTMSYMDYGNDACLYMFSQGQTDVVDNYVAGVLQDQFKPGTVPVCVEVPQYLMTNDSVTTCNGLFYDSGGPVVDPDPGNYSNNEVFTFTICPENTGQSTQLAFTEFATQNNTDIMSIYNASDATDPATLIGEYSGVNSPGTIAATLTNTSGCLTIVFTSNGAITSTGWLAFISCIDPPAECQTIVAQLDSASPTFNDEGVILVCIGEEISLSGSGQFSEAGGGVGAAYQWDIGDGTTVSGQTVTFSFDEPGVYIANLNIWDTNTSVFPEGCKNDNRINQYIQVSTTPTFEATEDTVNPICYGDTSTITPLVTPTPYINECTVPESNITFLPDGDGDSYSTCIVVDCFDEDQTLDLITQIQDICLNIEHSYLGDLDIIITSPNGQEVFLHQYPSGNSTYLGSPFDDFDNTDTAGVGADYCFSMSGTTELVNGATVAAGDPQGNSIVEGTYLPIDSFQQLVGSPLNGTWCITITDNIPQDNGYLFSWTLNFDTSIVPTSLSFTPEIVSGYWEGDEPTIVEINGDILTIAPDSDGEFCYTYTVLDNFGCEYSDEICVDVLPELVHDLPNDLSICDPVSSDAIFNLTTNEAVVLAPNANPENFVVTFHNTEVDAENDTNLIANPSSYVGVDGEVVFLRIVSK
jgi:subtilisin-like proprotein convertase family protein